MGTPILVPKFRSNQLFIMPGITFGAASIALAALQAVPASAFWRMGCPGRLTLERIDPLFAPGSVSGHVHTVSGGSGFGFDTDFDQLRSSACSSCPIKQDMSAYWTPKLYYMSDAEGSSFEDVPQSGEGGGNTGGMTVYYLQRGEDLSNITAFPEGFRMFAGDPGQRSKTDKYEAPGEAVSFVCLDYAAGSSRHLSIPNKRCPQGLRAQVFFPACWDGVNVDSPDHKSHMSYPIGNYDNGPCPSSHPVRLISIFYEVIYSVDGFDNRWWDENQHPFVFAQGDRTGFGFHGDFINGWDVDVLQKATDECTNDSGNVEDCPLFDLYTGDECQACRLPPSVDEPITGRLDSLPGCNPPTNGPEYAPQQPCNTPAISTPEQQFTDMTDKGWEFVGCGKDGGPRTFQGGVYFDGEMTVAKCMDYCAKEGYSYAGLEYASQCYCDVDYQVPDRAPVNGIFGRCAMNCGGDSSEVCGGPNALSIYRACDDGACNNNMFLVNGTGSNNRPRDLQSRSEMILPDRSFA